MTCSELSRQREIHDQLAEMVRTHPGRLWALCTVNPGAMDQAAEEVRRCVRELGFIGVKIHPWLQAISVVSNPGMPLVMEAAQELGAVVLFHDGSPPFSTPRQIGCLASRFPRCKVILGHSGLADLWRDAADVARGNPNVYLQPTAVPRWVVRAAYEAVGPERLLFGSDAGFASVRQIRHALRVFEDALGAELAAKIISRNHASARSSSEE